MLRPVMEKPVPRVPTLKKVRGDESIQRIIPIAEAQFLIGKSWDVSLKLNFSEVHEKHCTIEKISADAWTLSSHDNVTLQINDYVLGAGCTKLLKCSDYIRLSSNIMFQFECSSLTCDLCNILTTNEGESLASVCPSDRRTKLNFEQLLNSSKQLKYLQDFKDSSMNFYRGINDANLSHTSRLEGYRNLVNTREPLFELENTSEEYKNLHLKVLGDLVTYQCDFIEKLRNQLNEFFNDFKSVKDRSSYLESTNLHLKNENLTLLAKLARYIKNAEALRSENLNLQAEIVTLNAKQEELKSVIESKKKDTANENCCRVAGMSSNEIGRNCEAVMEVKTKLTKLLETEFKCTICDEVFVEAMVTNCGHTFCEHCLSTWKVIKPNCPICRSALIKENKSLAVDSYLNNIMPFASHELRTNWLKVVDERKSASENLRKNPAPKRKYSMVDYFLNETRYNLDRIIMRLNSTEMVSQVLHRAQI